MIDPDTPPVVSQTVLDTDDVRGLALQRYAGDAALFGNAELRVLLHQSDGSLFSRVGVFGLADVGRVFAKGQTSDRWHPAYGGGLWISIVEPSYTASIAVAESEGHVRTYLQGGFSF